MLPMNNFCLKRLLWHRNDRKWNMINSARRNFFYIDVVFMSSIASFTYNISVTLVTATITTMICALTYFWISIIPWNVTQSSIVGLILTETVVRIAPADGLGTLGNHHSGGEGICLWQRQLKCKTMSVIIESNNLLFFTYCCKVSIRRD